MIEQFKHRLAERIRQKDIGLVMIVDRGGRIRWHHGRPVSGRTVAEGWGFSRTHLLEVLEHGNPLESREVIISGDEVALPRSARLLLVGSLFIHPIDDNLVLYVDRAAIPSILRISSSSPAAARPSGRCSPSSGRWTEAGAVSPARARRLSACASWCFHLPSRTIPC
jgi:hypothetical protein